MSDDPAKVVSLHGEPVFAAAANEYLVVELERYLEMAKSGEIIGALIAVECRDRSSMGSFAGTTSAAILGECFNVMQRLSAKQNG